MVLEAGQIIDAKYRVVRRIGEGGMGTVYEGENSRIGRRVAIKVLHAQVASMPEFVERFEREARAAARIGSPHVCDVLDLGDLPNGDRYIVMEFLDGVSLEDRIVERGKMTCAQLAPIAFELLEGLGTMHVARVIHRDLKPANVFLARTPGGRGEVVKILDFGVAKLLPFGGEVGTMTQTGTMMGTPLYMSPEQARGARDVDGRTDIYAASVMFYRALAGVLPYNAESLNELLFKIVLEDPKPLRDVAPDVDEVFAEIVHKGLARDMNQRYASARAYQEAIARWGKTQGRSSLSFSVTLPSVPPEPPSKDPEPPRPVVAAVTAVSGGTPIAWSEDAASNPRLAARPNLPPSAPGIIVGAAPRAEPPAGAPAPSSSAPVSGAGAGARLSSDPRSGSTLASSGVAPGAMSASAEGPVIASATTMPTASTNDPKPKAAKPAVKDTAAVAAPTTSAGAASKRGLIAGIVGAGALAVVAIIAFGRGGAGPMAGAAPVTAASASADFSASASGTAATVQVVPKETASAAGDAAVTIAATASVAEPTSSTPAATVGPIATATARRNVATPVAAAAPTVALAAATPSATVQPTPSAKPAASARKFRTNLD